MVGFVSVSLLIGVGFFIRVSDESKLTALPEEISETILTSLSNSSKYERTRNDTKIERNDTLKNSNSDFSVLTNQVYSEDEQSHTSQSLYQRLMGRRGKVDAYKYQEENQNTEKTVSLGMFRRLVDAKNKLGDGILLQATDIIQAALDSEGMVMIKDGIRIILEAILHGIMDGFLPTVERVRREADGDKRTYLDMVSSVGGALMGRQKCSEVLACRTGKWFQGRLPAAQLAVMMVESVVPGPFLEWFGVVKKSVIDRSDNCDLDYECSLQDD